MTKTEDLPSNSEPKLVLVVDRDQAFGQTLQRVIGRDYLIQQETSTKLALSRLRDARIDALLVNLDSDEELTHSQDFRRLFHAGSDESGSVPVIAYSWNGRGTRAQHAIRLGAADVLEQPLDIEKLKFVLERGVRRIELVRELARSRCSTRIDGLLGKSKAMERVGELARKVAEVQTTVLITGESGTGKGVVAQAIHRMSQRAVKPFVAFSVCAFPDSLIEDELFGHERGAFTGAAQARRGRFEEANGGTIFIDEIGDLALPLQAKLLRVLQERTVERLGSNVSRPVDVRVICATHRNLQEMVEKGAFREDLFFRISVVKIPLPALRERKEDIPLLAQHFLQSFVKLHNKAARVLTPGFVRALSRYSWPGNVRELQNVMERCVVLADRNESLGIEDLPEELRGGVEEPQPFPNSSFHDAVHDFKRELVRSALRTHAGNRSKAALELRISRCYLHRLLNQLEIADDSAPDLNALLDEQIPGSPASMKRAGANVGMP